MKTDEDDEFDRIERENAMHEVQRLGKEIEGQPYHWQDKAIQAAVRMEREACAKLAEKTKAPFTATVIRARGQETHN